jgi:formylmethanofuran dehydrogenase subunit E
MNFRRLFPLLLFALLASLPITRAQQSDSSQAAALKEIDFVHGGHGPFAVAGYRIGERALKDLSASRSSFSLEVIHKTPAEVQWTCIADGVQAATGASVGKMNLKIESASVEDVETIVRDKKSGRTLVFHIQPSFTKRYLDLPHEKLASAGAEAIALPDDAIFTISSN